MSADAETLHKALVQATALLEQEKGITRLEAAERAARQFDLGPLDEEWLIQQIVLDPKKPSSSQ
jgi:hypothetical protein